MDATLVRETLAGYAAANDVIEAERQATLARMTNTEALNTWRDLVSSFNARSDRHQNLDRLDLWQVEGLLVVRRALDRMAEKQSAL